MCSVDVRTRAREEFLIRCKARLETHRDLHGIIFFISWKMELASFFIEELCFLFFGAPRNEGRCSEDGLVSWQPYE